MRFTLPATSRDLRVLAANFLIVGKLAVFLRNRFSTRAQT